MKKQIAISMLAAGALLFAVTSADAGDRKKGKKMRGDRMARVVEQLDLTVEQKAAIEKVRSDARQESKAAETKLRALRKQQRALWKAEQIDRAKAVKLQKQISKLHGELEVRRVETRIDMLATLTAEQRTELAKRKAQRPKDGKRRGKHGRAGKCGKGGEDKAGKRKLDKRAGRDRAARTDRGKRRGNGRPATANATL